MKLLPWLECVFGTLIIAASGHARRGIAGRHVGPSQSYFDAEPKFVVAG
jgi:hypothetical protein